MEELTKAVAGINLDVMKTHQELMAVINAAELGFKNLDEISISQPMKDFWLNTRTLLDHLVIWRGRGLGLIWNNNKISECEIRMNERLSGLEIHFRNEELSEFITQSQELMHQIRHQRILTEAILPFRPILFAMAEYADHDKALAKVVAVIEEAKTPLGRQLDDIKKRFFGGHA